MPKISAPTIQKHRAETVDRLLDAWGDLVMERGFDAVSLADVASEAGLARTAIYNYFSDREALLFAWTEREVARTLGELQQRLSGARSCSDKLRIFVHSQLMEFRTRHLPPGKDVMQFLRPETYERFMQHVEPLDTLLRQIIDEGVEKGEFARIDSSETVPMVMACIGAERVPLSTRKDNVDEATERVTGFILRALGAHPLARKKKASGAR